MNKSDINTEATEVVPEYKKVFIKTATEQSENKRVTSYSDDDLKKVLKPEKLDI